MASLPIPRGTGGSAIVQGTGNSDAPSAAPAAAASAGAAAPACEDVHKRDATAALGAATGGGTAAGPAAADADAEACAGPAGETAAHVSGPASFDNAPLRAPSAVVGALSAFTAHLTPPHDWHGAHHTAPFPANDDDVSLDPATGIRSAQSSLCAPVAKRDLLESVSDSSAPTGTSTGVRQPSAATASIARSMPAPTNGATGRWKRATSKVSVANTLRRAPSMNAVSRDRNVLDASIQRSIDPAFAQSFRMVADPDVPVFASPIPELSESKPETFAFDESRAQAVSHMSPVRWWVPRQELEGATSLNDSKKDDKASRKKAEAGFHWYGAEDEQLHKTFWYDPEAVLSRKASVRFRRSVDVMLPTFNEQVRNYT